MQEFNKICRVCMRSEQNLELIFGETSDVGIAYMLMACSPCKVVRWDALPQRICGACLASLRSAYQFRQNCEKSYRHMMQFVEKCVTSEDEKISELVSEYSFRADKETQTEASALHSCERCDKKFSEIDELLMHRINEHKGSSMACRFCSKNFDRIGYLRSHIAISHPESGCVSDSQCHICHRQFSRREHMRRHLRAVHKISNFPIATRKSHIVKVVDQGENDLEKDDEAAIANEHNLNEKPVLSSPCKTEATIANDHISDDEQLSLLKPIEPIQVVMIKENFEGDHIKLENFEEENTIDAIADEHKSDTEEDATYEPDDESQSSCISSWSEKANNNKKKSKSSIGKKFFCDDCQKSYANEKQYNKHRNTAHTAKSYSCSLCEKAFYRKIDLKEHLRVHNEKRFTCRECAQNFDTKVELDTHRKAEGHDRPMLCPECGLRCKSTSSLMAHIRRHTGEKPFKCKFCNKGFPRSDDLKQHEKYHTNEKSHFCETCGKGFQRKYHLTIHLRVHTGEKPFKCPHCPQAFSQNQDLKLHIRRHTGERLRCEYCDAAFLQGYKIRQHKLLVHGIKEEAPTQRLEKFASIEEQEQRIEENKKRHST